jgi:hypothetical protein
MAAWADFYPLVLPSVLGCPIPAVNTALRSTVRDFCERTREWRHTNAFTAPGVVNLFNLTLPANTELVRILSATVGDKEFSAFGRGTLPADWATCTPRDGLYHVGPESYRLLPVPNAGTSVSVELALMPSMEGIEVGDEVFQRYAESIADGAMARLMELPRQPWTDINMAMLKRAKYESAAHNAANRDFMQTSPEQRRVKKWG